MVNPVRVLRDIFDVHAANNAWDYKLDRPKLSPERKRRLLEESRLEKPRSVTRAWSGILKPYWTKAGPKEAATAAFLLGTSLLTTKWMVGMQVDFSFLSREVMDTVQLIFENVMQIRPAIFDSAVASYPDLKAVLADNPVLSQMLHKYPDTTSFRQLPDVARFMSQSHSHLVEWTNFLRDSPNMVQIFMKYPGMADLAGKNPLLLEQLRDLDVEVGKQLWSDNNAQKHLAKLGQIFATDFFTNWAGAFGSVVTDYMNPEFQRKVGGAFVDAFLSSNPSNPEGFAQFSEKWATAFGSMVSPQSRDAFDAAWNSKDFLNIVGKFMPLAIVSYKSAQTMALRWRAWTTGHYTNRWMDCKAFNRLKNEFSIDNPDQRIQDDPYRFTTASVNLVTGTVRTAISFAAYAGILWGLANMNLAYFGGPDYVVPGTMLWFAGSYAAGLTALTFAVGRKLPQIGWQQQMREANFRSALKKVQDNDDQIALNDYEAQEKENIRRSYVPVLNNQVREINTNIKLSIVDVTFGNLSIPIPMLAGAFAVASGSASMGTLQLLNSSFGVVTSGLSFLASRFEQFASMHAIASRLTVFDTAVEAARYLEEEKRQEGKRPVYKNINSTPKPL